MPSGDMVSNCTALESISERIQKNLCFHAFPFFPQDALSAELNNLGMNYDKELQEKPPMTASDKKSHSAQTWVDQEQLLKWDSFFYIEPVMSKWIFAFKGTWGRTKK